MDDDARLTELSDTLQRDRLVKIFIKDQSNPYLIPESLLVSLSECFARALKHEKTLGGEEGVLKFPEDDPKLWQILLHWKIKGHLVIGTTASTQLATLLLTQCWVLGDKYDIKEFQDLVMLDLLAKVDEAYVTIDLVKVAFENTPIGSPLRKLMAEELACVMPRLDDFKHEHLDAFDGIPGFTAALVAAVDRKRLGDRSMYGRLLDQKKWQPFMLEDGPKRHWVGTTKPGSSP